MVYVIPLYLASCGSGDGSGSISGGGAREWTYMVYMGADNNLSSAGLQDLNEMEKAGSTSDVAIVVQAEFSNAYTPGIPTETLRFYVQNDGDPSSPDLLAGTSIGVNVDMGDPTTLTDFITWAATNYPANHYALVIWSHGGGWKEGNVLVKGAVQDETSGSFMSLPNLASAVRNAGVHIDLINFDACLMAMYEVAYEFQGLADYMVASEESEPGEGDPYDAILGALTAMRTMTPRQLATTIVDEYDTFYSANNRGDTTKSAIDMSQISMLDDKIRALSTALQIEPGTASVVAAAQANTQNYTYSANHDLLDFNRYMSTNLPSGTAKATAGEIVTLVQNMVVANKTNGSGVSDSNGLAIFVPMATETNSTDLTEYYMLAINQAKALAAGTWGAYLDYFLGGSGGGSLAYASGGFGLYLYWVVPGTSTPCNADLDLYVWEPAVDFSSTGNGNWYAPWMGMTSPNGFLSQDSVDSGVSEEYYLANDQIYWGDYYFVVNYWKDGDSCSQAEAHLILYDPSMANWYELTSANVGFNMTWPSPQNMDLSNTWPGTSYINLTELNTYSDFWVSDMYYEARTGVSGAAHLGDLPLNDKNSQMIFRFSKASRL